MKDKKILLGLPNYSGFFHGPVVLSLMQMHKPLPIAVQMIEGLAIDKARNIFVKMMLDQGFDYLFFVDDDTVVPSDTLEKFLEADKDIICAPVLKSREPYEICCLEKADEISNGKDTIYNYVHMKDLPEGLSKIDACGSACILIKREVFEKVEEPYNLMDEIVDGQRRTMGEDVAFCERATKAGFEVWVDTRVRPQHLTSPRRIQFNDNLIK